jgi:ferredoxin/flavodoxin---NADP+ reductase
MSQDLNAVLLQRTEVASGLLILRVTPDGWDLPDWKSGQFAILGLPYSAPRTPRSDPEEPPAKPEKLIRRAYSIASASKDRDYLEFYITMVRSGELTPRLFNLEPGDRLFLGKKISGMFTLADVPEGSDLVFVGTGTGLAPYMSMLRGDVDCNPNFQTAVLLGARNSWDLGYRSELIAMQRFCSTFHYYPVISEPQNEIIPWSGPTGYVQDLWKSGALEKAWGRAPSPDRTHVLLCGNPGMIEGMMELLGNEGYEEHTKKSPGQIHVEKYW